MNSTPERWVMKPKYLMLATRDLTERLRGAAAYRGGATSDFDLNPGVRPRRDTLRSAAVLIGVGGVESAPTVWMTKRSSALKHHPGQIAFPGGKVEKADQSPERAAEREALEEIGLSPDAVNIVGTLPTHETVTGFVVTPVLARVDPDFVPVPDQGEVEEAFSVPLAHVINPDQYRVESRMWHGIRRHYFTVPFGPYYIWGATARMLRLLAEAMRG